MDVYLDIYLIRFIDYFGHLKPEIYKDLQVDIVSKLIQNN
jgi:hypothetical protein